MKGLNIALWIVQVLLMALYFFTGGVKIIIQPQDVVGPVDFPILFIRFLGVCEVLGAIGLVLPSLLRILPWLTPLAALGLTIILCGAVVINLYGGLYGAAGVTAVVLAGDVFVGYGRWRLVPIAPRGS